MPFRVVTDTTVEAPAQSGAFALVVELWPHSSLTGRGFAWTIGLLYAGLCVPLIGLLGTVALWGVLPFGLAAMGMLWLALRRSWRDREVRETFHLTPERARLERVEPDGTARDWEANPYWVRVTMHPQVNRVENYLTLDGGPRRVEIGAFLTPEERARLRDVIGAGLAAAR